mmetsp:Transcript_19985/g.33178  ORF Transcript_19985/g.33178 Transcript_19985/m.33178 type:complete len:200 (-) Transcript_19985:60-659(-)
MPRLTITWELSNLEEMISNRLGTFWFTSSRVASHGRDSRPSRPPRSTSLSWKRSSRSQSLPFVRVAHPSLPNILPTAVPSSLKPSQTLPTSVECSATFSVLRDTPTTTHLLIGTGTDLSLELEQLVLMEENVSPVKEEWVETCWKARVGIKAFLFVYMTNNNKKKCLVVDSALATLCCYYLNLLSHTIIKSGCQQTVLR